MITKYLTGGDIASQFVSDLVQTGIFGDETTTMKTIQQLSKEQPEVLKQLMEVYKQAGIEGVVKVIKDAQNARKAEKGAKLNRVMALSDRCPEGYMKKGGKCKKCEKGKKITDAAFHVTGYFQNGSKIQNYGLGGLANWDWQGLIKDVSAGIGNTIQTYQKAKTERKWLDTLKSINNSNNAAAIALAGAKNDMERSRNEAMINSWINLNRYSNYNQPFVPTWIQK